MTFLELSARALLALGASFTAPFAFAQEAPTGTGGLRGEVVFTDYAPLSGNAELARRLLSPLAAVQLSRALARSGKELGGQPVDLAKERFVVYAPARAPPHGYGLLVFVSPSGGAKLPEGWASVLDRYGVIFVAAAGSGNDAGVLARRAPLALLGAANIISRYRVDPQRVYVAGFSGGARVALRLALGYPDLFHGALLNAGSDPIGDGRTPLPPRDLFLQFQGGMRLVYVTGEKDADQRARDAQSMESMREWCVFDVDAQVMAFVGHAAPDAAALARALDALEAPARPDPAKLAGCRSAIERELTAQLQQVESLIAGGKRGEAQSLLDKIDRRFGGLAAPRSADLAKELE